MGLRQGARRYARFRSTLIKNEYIQEPGKYNVPSESASST